ncbi:cell surface protein, partial [Rickettsia asembonensis]
MNQDAGLMQQLKMNNPRLAAIIEVATVNEEEVATRLPESAAAQAVANGDINYGGVVVVAPAAAPVAPVAPLVLPADPEEDPEEGSV